MQEMKGDRENIEAVDYSPSPTSLLATRALDVILAICLLVFALPVMAAVSAFILVADGRPVLFTQIRTGCDERPFRILKFRTLASARGDGLYPIRGGEWLRRTSLDELPQLLNVLAGDMSFVGPRPLLPEYAEYYTDRERMRFMVRPGLTGLAQTAPLEPMDWDAKLAADVEFVTSYSFPLYFRILVATPLALKARMKGQGDWDSEKRLDVVRASGPQQP